MCLRSARPSHSPFTFSPMYCRVIPHSPVSNSSQGSSRLQGSNNSPFTLHHSRGFTVVELSVVLVVIELIFVSVLKLETVYRNYKIRQVVNHYRKLSAAVKVYRENTGIILTTIPRRMCFAAIID